MPDAVRLLNSEPERERWDAFLLSQDNATFCHLSSWKQIVEGAYNLPSYYLYFEKKGEISGILPLVHVRGLLAPNRLVSLPFLDQGGILASNEHTYNKLLEAATDLARAVNAKGVDLRHGSPRRRNSADQKRRYRFVTPLTGSSEQLWDALGPKVRNQIRKAEKRGLATSIAEPSQIPSFFRVFSRNMRDLGSPTHSERFFQLMAEALGQRFQLYLTRGAGEAIVAAAIAIRFGMTVTVPWASSLRSARSLCPNHSLYWKILQDAIVDGAKEFDFGRSTEGSGSYSFKKQWPTDLRPLGWTFWNSKGKPEGEYYLDPRAHSALPRIWRHIPVGVANVFGPVVRSKLPN